MPEPIERIANSLDALHCGACILDRTGTIVHANPRLVAMFDRPLDEMRGAKIKDFYNDTTARARFDRFFEHFGRSNETEGFIERPDGERIDVAVAAKALEDDAVPQHMVLTVIDVSRQARAYREIATLSDTVVEQAIELKHHKERLEERVRERTAQLRQANLESIYMLAIASETRDADTGAHVRRIQRGAELMARELGMEMPDAEHLGYSAILHDVGKIQVADSILKKPGPLTPEERQAMEQHTIAGEHILSDQAFFELARRIARSHHENWDGTGYPDGTGGEEIPIAARIVKIIDVFDALTSKRVYKPAWSQQDAIDAVRDGGGMQFDPELVTVFDSLIASGALLEALRRSPAED
jgi:PAS domain S-box-containing protein